VSCRARSRASGQVRAHPVDVVNGDEFVAWRYESVELLCKFFSHIPPCVYQLTSATRPAHASARKLKQRLRGVCPDCIRMKVVVYYSVRHNLQSCSRNSGSLEEVTLVSTDDVRPCPFCTVAPERVLLRTEKAVALFDGYPITEGHALVIPQRHVASIYELAEAEQAGLWSVVARVRALLLERYAPDGFNIGLNDGAAAGQTVGHAHIHVIPRRVGDVPDSRGGVRWIFPDKAKYW